MIKPIIAGKEASSEMTATHVGVMAQAAWHAYEQMRRMPCTQIADFLCSYADEIQKGIAEIADVTVNEVNLSRARLSDGGKEAGRTWKQLKATGEDARRGSYALPTIATDGSNMRSMLRGYGPFISFDPNNFPLAFNCIAGGSFANAIKARCPVIGKAHRDLGGTTRAFALGPMTKAVKYANMPMEMINVMPGNSNRELTHAFLRHHRIAGGMLTGSKQAGLALGKTAAEYGKLWFAEMESPNYTFVLPDFSKKHGKAIASKIFGAMELGFQFCTCTNTIFVQSGTETELLDELTTLVKGKENPSLALGNKVLQDFEAGCSRLDQNADLVVKGTKVGEHDDEMSARVYKVNFEDWIKCPSLWEEVFGWATLVVLYDGVEQVMNLFSRNVEGLGEEAQSAVVGSQNQLPGSLCFSIWGEESEFDSEAMINFMYDTEHWAGRLLMTTNPADSTGVSPGLPVNYATGHGGPFPATNNDRFTAVGHMGHMFFMRWRNFHNWNDSLLPVELQAKNPLGIHRLVNGEWTTREA